MVAFGSLITKFILNYHEPTQNDLPNLVGRRQATRNAPRTLCLRPCRWKAPVEESRRRNGITGSGSSHFTRVLSFHFTSNKIVPLLLLARFALLQTATSFFSLPTYDRLSELPFDSLPSFGLSVFRPFSRVVKRRVADKYLQFSYRLSCLALTCAYICVRIKDSRVWPR